MPDILSFSGLLALVRMTWSDGRGAVRMVLAAGLPRAALWLIFLTLACLSGILNILTFELAPAVVQAGLPSVSGITATIMETGFALIVVTGVYQIGRRFGGTGTFDQVLAAMCLLKVMSLFITIAQVVAIYSIPLLASLIGIAGLAYLLWLLVQFISEVHGFDQSGVVFMVVIISLIGLFFLLGLLLTALGVKPM